MKRFGSLLWVSVVLVTGTAGVGFMVPAAVASTGDRAGQRSDDLSVPGSDPAALLLLQRAERAAYTVPYSGVRYLATWCPRGTTSAIIEVAHVPGVGTTIVMRHTAADPNGQLPVTDLAADQPVTVPSADGPATAGLVARNFQVVVVGLDEVAGRTAAKIEARRPGAESVAARLWVDTATALVLRIEVFDGRGAAVRASGFIAIKQGQPGQVRPQSGQPPAAPTVPGTPAVPAGLDRLRAVGWTVPAMLPQGLRLYDVRTMDSPTGQIVHASYSDGLSTVSVFAQHGRLDTGALSGYAEVRYGDASVYVHDGTPRRVMWAADGMVYTILTDAPEDMIQSVLATLPRDTGDGGVLARVGRGMTRVGSWFNPFG
jgi:sigma-E factor negative regulatory protein RseB